MTLDGLQARLGRFRYKPGMRFVCQPGPQSGQVKVGLHVAEQRNACREGHTCELHYDRDVFWYDLETDEQLQQVVLWLCEAYERHELYEWLKLDGKHVKDPHYVVPLTEALEGTQG